MRVSPYVHMSVTSIIQVYGMLGLLQVTQNNNIKADIDFTPLCSSILGELDGP